MDFQETGLPGCYTVQARRIADSRGSFTKTFHVEAFEALRLRTDWREDYHSSSRRGVLRGMQFTGAVHTHRLRPRLHFDQRFGNIILQGHEHTLSRA
jgi:dTDP-4-dehydrorhamnose 3,5-epimerase